MKRVIIIGAGMGGLTAAAYLAKAGMNVQIYEQHQLPGGYISSFTRKGFTFPAGPTSFVSNGIVFPILQELGLENSCRFERVIHQMSWDETDVPFLTPIQTRDALIQVFPHERRALHKFFRWVDIGERGFHGQSESGLYFSGGKGVLGKILKMGIQNPLFPLANAVAKGRTNRSLYARFFKDERLIHLLGNLAYPVMAGPFTLGLWATYYGDYFTPVGGMQCFSNMLVRYICDRGGQLRLNQRVEKILVEDGTARGVRLADGSEVRADWVVSAADMRSTMLDLIGSEHLQATTVQKLATGQPSESILAVFLGLDDSREIEAGLSRFQASHVSYHHDDGGCTQLALLTKDDASIAPYGKSALWIGRLEDYQDWEGLDQQAYRQKKEEQTLLLIKKAEEFVPHLSQHIEVCEAATPLTYERYTANWRGAISGWSWDPARAPKADFVAEAGVKNFYCVGHWVFKPAGVPAAMITSWYIARDILAKSKSN